MAIEDIILGSFLASFFQILFDKLTSLALRHAQQEGIITASLEEWKEQLATINAVLADAEDKQLNGTITVKLWLDDVKDLAYDMEDLLDEFMINATQVESEAESSTNRGMEECKLPFFGRMEEWKLPFFGQDKSSRSNSNLRLLVPEAKIQEINRRLKAIVTRKADLKLTATVADGSKYTNKRDQTTSIPEPLFVGRETEKAQLLERLISGVENSDATLSIVPIVGMGGVGKTALAQELYNDDTVKSYFERRAWVYVSDVFDVLDITKTILRSITKLSCEGSDLNGLQIKLKESLSGKKFLVVLDDVWNENYLKWNNLLKPLKAGAKGSKIIVTSRKCSAVSIRGASLHFLEELSLDNCTSLLAFHALGETNFKSHPHLETIGKELAKKCKGLPLAAMMLGGALCNEMHLDKWEAIVKNKIWDLPKGKKDEVLPVLKLSYVDLPSYLKRCFAYCAVFPKGYEIERDELVLLWIAEGLLDGQKAKEDILTQGRDHFDELVSRSFFQQSRVNASKFSMHDLLNDLANSIMGGTCFSSGDSQLVDNEHDASSLEKTRYASFISPRYVTSICLKAYRKMKVLRSLILLPARSSRDSFFISPKVVCDLLTNLKYLRAFSLCHCNIMEVPSDVGKLKHIRYLNFSHTKIKRLPKSIGGLCKLQALILRGCQNLLELPPGITKLVSLQFLDIRDTSCLKEMPLGICNLKNLTILSKFVVRPKKGSPLKELKKLPHLQGELLISELQMVEEAKDAVDKYLLGKQGLTNLSLHWGEDFRNLRNSKREVEVLQSLQPHTNLENLTISYYGGAKFPSWLHSPSYSKMVSLCLRECPNVEQLPPLGQLPSLRELSLEGLHVVRKIGSKFYEGKRPFSSLTILKFKDMSAWKEWSCYVGGPKEEVPFSRLQHLVVQNCPSLVGALPCQLNHLIKLEMHSCPYLHASTSVVFLPCLCELYLEDCDKEILKIFGNLTSLTILKIGNLAELVCFDHEFMSCLVKLKEFHIGTCDKLTYLWQDKKETQILTCLKELAIQSCPLFTSFIDGEGEIEPPCNLERIKLMDCASLEKLPNKMHTVKDLTIHNCPKIIGQTIPPYESNSNNPMSQLQSVVIGKCESSTSFPFAKGRFAALNILEIMDCEGVESLEEITAESLISLTIARCKNLGSLPRCFHTLSHLTHLYIHTCPALEIEDFPPIPITLSSFDLINCPKIKSLPNQWHHLTSLHELHILNCENINCLPKGGLPPNLHSLAIVECKNLKQPLREWDLHMLTSLEELSIDGRSMGGDGEVSFPSEDEDSWSLLFPSSLISLFIQRMYNVERLSSGLRNHLSSLRALGIANCPKLRYLPEDGLPPSLERLDIYGCEILKDEVIGDYWPHVQEIPFIWIKIW